MDGKRSRDGDDARGAKRVQRLRRGGALAALMAGARAGGAPAARPASEACYYCGRAGAELCTRCAQRACSVCRTCTEVCLNCRLPGRR